jgi:predicted O-methyltransferase YrrM
MNEIEIPHHSLLEQFKNTHGAMSVAEGIALYNITLASPHGIYLELGSHRGKSSQMIAAAMDDSSELILVEPEFEDDEWRRGVSDLILKTNRKIEKTLISGYSLDVIPSHNRYAFVFVDSGVHDDMVTDECKLLEDRVVGGGVIAFHDFRNQFTAVERAYNYMLGTGKYEEIEINWPLILRENREEGNTSWHQYPELGHAPNFIGALRRKFEKCSK